LPDKDLNPTPPGDPHRVTHIRGPRPVRRIVILTVGAIVLLGGLLISPLPGPGFTVLGPLGLAILATEFAWARRLLKRVDDRTDFLDRYAPWLSSPWAVAALFLVIVGYWIAAVLVVRAHPDHSSTTWMFAGLLFLPISAMATFIALAARRRWHAARAARRASINRSVGE
jgi:uncharacterized protein (TIGR02611 family)